ncbi:hypothetical protein [Uliginosibacterium sediminicola]|uniref:Uncharacterized protein n=1 Tax=Uliginosibacterium sediminicola TaxID=2024550 RepID=A0ABU9Z4M9_9RHOO
MQNSKTQVLYEQIAKPLRGKAPVSRIEKLQYLDQNKVGARLLFAGNLTRQPYMPGRNYGISGELINTYVIMNNTFWIGMQPALTRSMLELPRARSRLT